MGEIAVNPKSNVFKKYKEVIYVNSYRFSKAYDPDTQVFITAAGLTDNVQKSAINTLVVDLKLNGLWSKMQAIYPFIGGTDFTHKFNLKDPRDLDEAFRIVFSGTITHDSLGITYGASSAGITNFIMLNNSVINDFHWSAYIYETANIYIFQAPGGGQMFNYINISGSKMLSDLYNTTGGNGRVTSTVTNAYGYYLASRLTNPTHSIYKNGTKLNSNNLTAGTLTDQPISIGKSSSASGNFRFVTIGKGLTDSESANLNTIIQQFQTALGRQL